MGRPVVVVATAGVVPFVREAGGHLAAVTVKSFFASRNPVAQMRQATTVEEVLGSGRVADPLTMFQYSPKSDGAAAVVVIPRGRPHRSKPSDTSTPGHAPGTTNTTAP